MSCFLPSLKRQGYQIPGKKPQRAHVPRNARNRRDDRSSGGAEGIRTPDLRIANATLSRLSYSPPTGSADVGAMPRNVKTPPLDVTRKGRAFWSNRERSRASIVPAEPLRPHHDVWHPSPRAGTMRTPGYRPRRKGDLVVTTHRHLLSPITIRGHTFRNRVFSSAHAPGYAVDGLPGDRYQAYHEAKARGGIGLTMFGGSSNVSRDSGSIYGQIYVGDDRVIPAFRELSRRVHRHGAGLMCQITHMGRRTTWDSGDWLPTRGPSAFRDPAHHSVPYALSSREIARIVKGLWRCGAALPGRRARWRRDPGLNPSGGPVPVAALQRPPGRLWRRPC